ncbi:hypothetical protein B0T17DRAFT_232316 [Bombardia bombarda]|uniref:Chitin deacetylase n=1 Tax=Bombardia bombarda TaxID=252184 RepID=A0AA40CB15_9PEZI|nr:hypothetical protein B0T17DRAFT_232316 [Bombardia bombarda]
MKLSCALLAASFGLVAAHNDHEGRHIPKLLGGRKFLSDVKVPRATDSDKHIPIRQPVASSRNQGGLERRADDAKCGAGVGSCDAGYCCSYEGWCGKTKDYCTAPDCQLSYGPACDGNKKPSGVDTSGVARPKSGNVLYGGTGVYDCVNNGDVALTFDDGPYLYTDDLLDKLKSYGAKATFFITGTNIGKGMINDPATPYPAILRRMHAEGHQIASHTWSHENASQMTNTQFTNQMVWNEIAINSVLGFFPTYMRPPYSICEKNCQSILSTLGYHTIYFDLDTAGYLNDSPVKIQTSKNIWDQAMQNSDPEDDSFLQIEHDIHSQTVYNLTDYVLTSLFANGYQAVTVGQCLGDPASNWYRNGPPGSVSTTTSSRTSTSTSTSRSSSSSSSTTNTRSTTSIRTSTTSTRSSATPTPTSNVSTNGSCGNGVTCSGSRFGTCCSSNNFCGSTDDYCLVSNGCQAAFGSCQGTTSSSTVKTTSTTTRKSTTTATPTPTGLPVSTDGKCGADYGKTCVGSAFGTCCGPLGDCSSSTIACLSILGCQVGYGQCV